jgi:methyl-accepting chemotaxis protein
MNRLRYRPKFALISLMFSVPLVFMLYLWLDEIHQRIAFADKERAGIEYVSALHGLLQRISLAAGDRVTAAIAEVDANDARLGAYLDMRERWAERRSAALDTDAPAETRCRRIIELIAHAGDTSNLILDPDLDSYYLMDAVVTRLPALACELIAAPPSRQRAKADVASVLFDGILRGHEVVFLENTALHEVLQPSLTELDDSLKADDRRALAALFVHQRAAVQALDGLLEKRIEGFAERRALLLAVVGIALAGVVYLWSGFYLGVLRAVRALDEVSERMRRETSPDPSRSRRRTSCAESSSRSTRSRLS